MKLFARYNRINLMAMSIIFVLTGIGYYLLINAFLIHELDETLADYKYKIDKYAAKHQAFPNEDEIIDDVVVSYHLTNNTHAKPHYLLTSRYDKEKSQQKPFRALKYVQQVGHKYYEIEVARPLEGTKLLTKMIASATLLLLLLIIIISLALNHLVLKRLWQSFYQMLDMLKNFKLNQREVQIPPQTDIDEFKLLGSSLQEMFQAAQKEFQTLKEFTENAAHELQTPLAIIRSKLDILVQEEGLSEIQADALKNVYTGIKRLTKLNQSLLLLVKMENHHFTTLDHVDMRERTTEKIEQFREIWEDNKITVQYQLDAATIDANAEMVDILLNNLLSNAGMHNHPQGSINIQLHQGSLVVSNTGSPTSLDKVRLYSRFYKEAQHSRHNGLGLSIVKQICEQSGITISYSFVGERHAFTLNW